MSRHKLFIIITIFITIKTVYNFNIDIKHPTIFVDPDGQFDSSYFGFSVALRRSAPGNDWDSWLLVGAPRANSSLREYSNIYQPGVVYQCRLKDGQSIRPFASPACTLLIMDSSGDETVIKPNINGFNYKHYKKDAWIGASIDVEDEENGRVVACGPKWVNQFYDNNYLMNGICYTYDKGSNLNEEAQILTPLVARKKQSFHLNDENNTAAFYYALGGAGISAQFVKSKQDGENISELIIGAPGIFDWKGSIVRYRGKINNINGKVQYDEMVVPNPGFITAIDYIGYFGYSIGAGTFFPNDPKIYYVSGAPRGLDYRGKVILHTVPDVDTREMSILRELNGQQMGEYFGASLCVADINGDGKPDLIVGAPGHSLPYPQGDEGRIYVFINDLYSLNQGLFKELTDSKIMGTQQYRARFGTTVMNIGDINLDGYEDIAVGAPYEDEGSGTVYIYHGRKNGLTSKFSQRIAAKEINPIIKGFGISVSRAVDIDRNYYNDFAVGAYTSGHVVIFRSHPVISFQGSIKTNVDRISFNASGFQGRACIFYTGKNVPLSISAKITVQVDPVYKRANFVTSRGKSNILTFTRVFDLNEFICQNFTVEIKALNQDFSKPIDLQMSADVDKDNYRKKRQTDEDFCKFCPVVDPNNLSSITARVPYSTGCKEDGVCKTDLILKTSIMNGKPPIIIGTKNILDMEVSVINDGEPAFLSQVIMKIPRKTPLLRIPQICSESPSEDGPLTLKCDLGNPLPTRGKVIIPLQLDLRSVPAGTGALDIQIKSTSVGEEINDRNNDKNLTIALLTKADISITGKSIRANIPVDWHNKTQKPENISFKHTFEVVNLGPSPVEQAKVTIKIPYMIINDKTINFVRIWNPQALLDGKSLRCTETDGQYYKENTVYSESTPLGGKRIKRDTNKEMQFDGKIPVNRTLFVNCSQSNTQCINIECIIGPLKNQQNVATISFQLLAELEKIEKLVAEKDIMLLSSSGLVEILSLPASVQPENHRPDEVTINTMFLAKIPEGKVQSWLLILAIILGILILLLIILALVKLGFFKRSKKSELDALKHKQLMEDEFGDL